MYIVLLFLSLTRLLIILLENFLFYFVVSFRTTYFIYSYINNDFYKKNFVLKYQDIYKSRNNTFSFEKSISIENVETLKLGDIVSFSLGIKTSDDNRFVFQTAIDDTCYKFLRGRNIQRWSYPINNEWLW